MAKRKVHNERGAGRKPIPIHLLRAQLHLGMRKVVLERLLTKYTKKELQKMGEAFYESLYEKETIRTVNEMLEE